MPRSDLDIACSHESFKRRTSYRDKNADAARRVTNNKIGGYVGRRQAFSNSKCSVYALWTDDNTYVVYSYGEHFAMYLWCEASQKWYGNSDKYSRTTSAHQRYAHPPTVDLWCDAEDMRALSSQGVVGLVRAKVTGWRTCH